MGKRSSGSGDYEVGRGCPPKSTRWKPGQSGNPKGRPKGSKNMATLLDEALNQTLEIKEKGKMRKITAREALAKITVSEALKGDLKMLQFVYAKERQIPPPPKPIKLITSDMTLQEASKAYAETLKSRPF